MAKLTGKRVLVVEDEALVSMLVEDTLLDKGAKIVGPAATVYDALRLIDEAQVDGAVDAAVLDLNLGGEIAIPVADKLCASGIPFLIATGYGENCDTGGHMAAPVLPKPFDPDVLVTAVTALTAER
ncbi:response regulator [Belnapia sp. T18]|uniref:Response regulator n=1 Tax=Belnapia arida TaxID=2804533 RepID=A0ABS1U719_9PROT|nr:response regulator [Belnapia arida]MBL6080480.1 response regulator [Belnapia arida]